MTTDSRATGTAAGRHTDGLCVCVNVVTHVRDKEAER